jgi:hypothetical protein
MALVPCRECGKSISTEATSCPHCGCPVRAAATAMPATTAQASPPSTPPQPAIPTNELNVLGSVGEDLLTLPKGSPSNI